MRKSLAIPFVAVALSASLLSACGPQPKPAELTALEELHYSKESAAIKTAAPEAYKKSTDLYDSAIQAWQAGDLTRAAAYADLGKRQYATATTTSTINDAQARTAAANAEIAILNANLETLRAKKEGLSKNIQLMKENIANNSSANTEQRIKDAQIELEKATGVGAKELQPELFKKGNEDLKKAADLIAAGQRDEASALAESAKASFAKAYELAKPEFDKQLNTAKAAERQKSLFSAIQKVAGSANAYQDHRGIVMVIPAAFEKGSTSLVASKYETISQIAQICKDYPEASVVIEGYAQSSGKDHVSVTQSRANSVRDMLVQKGVEGAKITTNGKGKENIRYTNKKDANKNDRVEIIFNL